MNRTTAELMCRVTEDFYLAMAGEFSRTRGSAWPGWAHVLDAAGIVEPASQAPLTVLDVGCGNLRFERFLRKHLPTSQLECFCIDNCEALLPDEETLANDFPFVRFQRIDVLGRLVHGADFTQLLEAPRVHLATCFGLMHHVPGQLARQALLNQLVACARPGGHVVVSYWRFMDSPELAERAIADHARALASLGLEAADFDEGDYLLGWQNLPDVFRFCHHFTHDEVAGMLSGLPSYVREVARFDDDGRTGALNTYIVLAVD